MPDTGRGSRSTAPSTCHHAAVRPAGRAMVSAAASSWPFNRKVLITMSVNTSPAGVRPTSGTGGHQRVEVRGIARAVVGIPGFERLLRVQLELGEDFLGELQ